MAESVISIRPSVDDDIEYFYAIEHDPEAARRVVWIPREREVFFKHWREKILGRPDVGAWTVLVDGENAGSYLAWEQDGKWWIGYWLGREHWGKGVGGAAMRLFLEKVTARPLYADPVETNTASVRLLEKSGFVEVERERSASQPGGEVHTHVVLRLDG